MWHWVLCICRQDHWSGVGRVRKLSVQSESTEWGHPYSRTLAVISTARRVAGLPDLDITSELGRGPAKVIADHYIPRAVARTDSHSCTPTAPQREHAAQGCGTGATPYWIDSDESQETVSSASSSDQEDGVVTVTNSSVVQREPSRRNAGAGGGVGGVRGAAVPADRDEDRSAAAGCSRNRDAGRSGRMRRIAAAGAAVKHASDPGTRDTDHAAGVGSASVRRPDAGHSGKRDAERKVSSVHAVADHSSRRSVQERSAVTAASPARRSSAADPGRRGAERSAGAVGSSARGHSASDPGRHDGERSGDKSAGRGHEAGGREREGRYARPERSRHREHNRTPSPSRRPSPRHCDVATPTRHTELSASWKKDHGTRKADDVGRWSSPAGRGRGRGARSAPRDRRRSDSGVRDPVSASPQAHAGRGRDTRTSREVVKREGDSGRADAAVRSPLVGSLSGVYGGSGLAEPAASAPDPAPPVPSLPRSASQLAPSKADAPGPFQTGRRPLSLDLSNLDGKFSNSVSQRNQSGRSSSGSLNTQPGPAPAAAASASADPSALQSPVTPTAPLKPTAPPPEAATSEATARAKPPATTRSRTVAPKISANKPIVAIQAGDETGCKSGKAAPPSATRTAANKAIMDIAFANGASTPAGRHGLVCRH